MVFQEVYVVLLMFIIVLLIYKLTLKVTYLVCSMKLMELHIFIITALFQF